MLYLYAHDALKQAKTSTDEARKARGSEFAVMKHYRAAKNALASVDAMKADPEALEDMVAAFLNLAVVLDSSGKQFRGRAAKCRQRAGALR